MIYDQEALETILRAGCERLLNEQPMLFQPEVNINERTVAGELSTIIRENFTEFHTNCEYNRMTDEYGNQIPKKIDLNPYNSTPSGVFPDIIIHRQENRDHNLLVIEIKMSWKNSGKNDDLKKLERYVSELGYKYGLYLELGVGGIVAMEWFQ